MAAPMMRSAGFGGSSPTTTKPTASPEPVMPTLPETMSATATASSTPPSPASMDYLDEFSQFDQTFGASYGNSSNNKNSKNEHNNNNNNNSNDDNTNDSSSSSTNNNSSSTLWDVMLSLYLPVLLLWLRRSMFGTANLIRSLILGHFLRLFFGNLSGWMSEKAPSWLAVTLQSTAQFATSTSGGSGAAGGPAASSNKLDQWPPPAFVALALLTIFTLVVHPDGFTWIMLGKLRDAMLSLFHTSAHCWNLVVEDYGVIPTIAAATTFAVLLFLSFCMLRTLAPRGSSNGTTPHPHAPEKKKKKRKGQARHRGGGGSSSSTSGTRIKSSSSSNNHHHSNSSHTNSDRPAAAPAPPNKSSIPEHSSPPDLTPLSPTSSCAKTVQLDPTIPCPEMKKLPEAATTSTPTSFATTTSSPSEGKPYEKERRSRVSSVSTLDTSALSDDQSCESASVRSIPSVSASSSRSYVDQEAQQQQPPKSNNDNNSNKNNNNKKPNTPSSNRRNKKNGKGKSPKHGAATADTPLVASSRWDALKPRSPHHHARPKSPNNHSGSQQHQPHGHYNSNNNHHHHNNNNNNSNVSKHHGRGGGRNNRKGGRHHNNNSNSNSNNNYSNQQSSAAANTFFSKNAPVARAHSPVQPNNTNASSRPRSPVSPPVLASKRTDGQQLLVSSNPMPPPPPGLGPLPSATASSFGVTSVAGGLGGPAAPGMTNRMTMPRTNTTNNNNNATPAMFGGNNQTVANRVSTSSSSSEDPFKYVSPSFLTSNAPPSHFVGGNSNGMMPVATGRNNFAALSRPPLRVKENPFAPDDSQIEADLQELGGQMAGSILDF